MKKILYSVVVAIVMIACQKYPEPEYVVPTYELKEYQTLISIEDLKARHTLGGTPTAIMGDTVIRGILNDMPENYELVREIKEDNLQLRVVNFQNV